MKKAFLISLLPLASLAGAQTITSDATAAYGLGPSITTNSSSVFASLGDPFNPFAPVTADAVAEYDESTTDGFRHGRSETIATTDWSNAYANYGFSVDNALYFYLSGYTTQTSDDELTFTNPDGATQGKYRVVLTFTKSGDLPELSANGGFLGFNMTNVTTSGTYVSPEMNFSYDSPFSTGLNFSSQASSGVDFISFDTRSRSGGMSMYARLELTDLGGAHSFGYSSRANGFYDIQAVPEPGSMAALAVGVGGLLRRRLARKES